MKNNMGRDQDLEILHEKYLLNAKESRKEDYRNNKKDMGHIK